MTQLAVDAAGIAASGTTTALTSIDDFRGYMIYRAGRLYNTGTGVFDITLKAEVGTLKPRTALTSSPNLMGSLHLNTDGTRAYATFNDVTSIDLEETLTVFDTAIFAELGYLRLPDLGPFTPLVVHWGHQWHRRGRHQPPGDSAGNVRQSVTSRRGVTGPV